MQHCTATQITNPMQCPALGVMLPHAYGSTPRMTSDQDEHLSAAPYSGTTVRMTSHLDVHLLRNGGQLIPMLQRQSSAQGDLLHLAVCSLVCLDCSGPVSPELCQCTCLRRSF